jgi:hypothetical protein
VARRQLAAGTRSSAVNGRTDCFNAGMDGSRSYRPADQTKIRFLLHSLVREIQECRLSDRSHRARGASPGHRQSCVRANGLTTGRLPRLPADDRRSPGFRPESMTTSGRDGRAALFRSDEAQLCVVAKATTRSSRSSATSSFQCKEMTRFTSKSRTGDFPDVGRIENRGHQRDAHPGAYQCERTIVLIRPIDDLTAYSAFRQKLGGAVEGFTMGSDRLLPGSRQQSTKGKAEVRYADALPFPTLTPPHPH